MEWLNARQDAPVMFGKYFVKINGIKQIIDFHEFDFYLNRGEEVLWLNEGPKKNVSLPVADNIQPIIKPKEKIVVPRPYVNIYDKKDALPTKEEVKKFLNKNFSVYYDGLTLKSVKHLFPQLKNKLRIPDELKSEMIDIYTKEGVSNIEFKLRRSSTAMKSQRKKLKEDLELENKLITAKESDVVDHFKETMKYVGIEFIPVPTGKLMYSPLIDKI